MTRKSGSVVLGLATSHHEIQMQARFHPHAVWSSLASIDKHRFLAHLQFWAELSNTIFAIFCTHHAIQSHLKSTENLEIRRYKFYIYWDVTQCYTHCWHTLLRVVTCTELELYIGEDVDALRLPGIVSWGSTLTWHTDMKNLRVSNPDEYLVEQSTLEIHALKLETILRF